MALSVAGESLTALLIALQCNNSKQIIERAMEYVSQPDFQSVGILTYHTRAAAYKLVPLGVMLAL